MFQKDTTIILDNDEEIDIDAHISRLNDALTFKGKCVAITGKLRYEREFLIAALEAQGATYKNQVSSKTDILVVGDRPGATKVYAATKHDVDIVEEVEFFQRIRR